MGGTLALFGQVLTQNALLHSGKYMQSIHYINTFIHAFVHILACTCAIMQYLHINSLL
jgi:hypothetical protein